MLLVRDVALAYQINLKASVALCMSSIQIMNNNGSRIEHCGTPVLVCNEWMWRYLLRPIGIFLINNV